jgi:hypothetical protein
VAADSVWVRVFDQGEGSDILDAIVAEGRCGTCGTPWDRVVNVEGKRVPKRSRAAVPTTCASWATGSPDPWLETGCWRDVLDDQEGMRTCEADPDPGSALGLCQEHETQLSS